MRPPIAVVRRGGEGDVRGKRATLAGARWGILGTADAGVLYLFDIANPLHPLPRLLFTSLGAFVFDVSTPQHPLQVLKLTASDSQIGDWFGWSVAITETRIVLGAPQTLEIAGGAASVPRGEALP